MLDIKLIRERPEIVRNDLKKRGDQEKINMLDDLIEGDKQWRQTLTEVNNLRHKLNVITSEIAKLKKKGEDASKHLKEAKRIPQDIKKLEKQAQEYKEKNDNILLKLPNILHESVPFGIDESENAVVKVFGKPPKFNFKPKSHAELAANLNLLDEERAAKVAGTGFYYLKGALALLDQAVSRYAVDFLMKRGYLFIIPPCMLRRDAYQGMVDLADFENVMYKIENEDLFMIATAEHPMGAMFKDEVLKKSDLPIKFVGISTNFRREIGSHGKYTKGLFRVHQFNKVEQFIFSLPEISWEHHEELQRNSEELYEGLGLHFKVVNVCTGDIGTIAAKKYDILVWMADGEYREAGSNSNCTDYQARRLNIRYREKEGQAPAGFVHTLNNTALATSRTIIAILEQYQQKDGTVTIPEALRPFMGGIERLE